MKATIRDGEWVVIDEQGGTWTPNETAAAEIAAATDQAAMAVKMCTQQPGCGRWQD